MSKTTTLPTLAELAACEYDPQRSTKWSAAYQVASKSTLGQRYKVVLDERTGEARCGCTAASFGKVCSHVTLARVLAAAKWFEGLLSDCSAAELRAMIPAKETQVRSDTDALNAHGALCAISALLAAADDGTSANLCPECNGCGFSERRLSDLRDYETGEYLDTTETTCAACDGTGVLTAPAEVSAA